MVSTFPHDHRLLLFSLAVIYLDPDNVCDKTNSVYLSTIDYHYNSRLLMSWVFFLDFCNG